MRGLQNSPLTVVFPWLLGLLALPVSFLPGQWSYTSLPLALALVAFGYWLIWPRLP